MKNIRHQWLRYSLCFVLLVVLFSPILDSFATHFPVGQRIMGTQDGQFCLNSEKTQWIKEFEGKDGCVKVDYKVHTDCGKFSEQHRIKNGMSDCQAPKGPTSEEIQEQKAKAEARADAAEAEARADAAEARADAAEAEARADAAEARADAAEAEARADAAEVRTDAAEAEARSSNSKINQDDDYVLWAVLGIVGIVGIVGIIKLITKSNNTGTVPPPLPPGGGNDGGKSEIEIETEETDEQTRRIYEELDGENSSSGGNTPTDIEEGYDYEENEDQGAAEIEDDYENDDQSNDDQSNDDQSNDENESIREDIEERISNNEEALEGLREYSQEIEDDKEDGEFAEIHDMHESDRTDDEISEREERIEELNEALDDYESQSDDNDHDDDYDDDR